MKYLPLILRNLLRNKLRSLLTLVAIAFAISLVCILRTMPAGLNALLEHAGSNTRISVHNEAGLVYPLPYSYLRRVKAVPGVVAAASWTWYGGAFEEEKGVTFPNFAVEPDALGRVWEDWKVSPKALAAFRRYRDGALVGRQTLRKYGWKVGDLVTLKGTLFPGELRFRIVGEIPVERLPTFFFQREYLDQTLQAQGSGLDWTGMIWARVDDPSKVAGVMAQIDQMFRNSPAETASETEKSYFRNFFGMLQGFVTVILIVTALVALTIVFIAANTASMSVRERFREIAILKAIGFRRRVVFGMLLVEATTLATLGGVAGAGASLALTDLMRRGAGGATDPALGPLAGFVVTNAILVEGIFLALAIGIVAGVIPSFGAARRSVAATMREVF